MHLLLGFQSKSYIAKFRPKRGKRLVETASLEKDRSLHGGKSLKAGLERAGDSVLSPVEQPPGRRA